MTRLSGCQRRRCRPRRHSSTNSLVPSCLPPSECTTVLVVSTPPYSGLLALYKPQCSTVGRPRGGRHERHGRLVHQSPRNIWRNLGRVDGRKTLFEGERTMTDWPSRWDNPLFPLANLPDFVAADGMMTRLGAQCLYSCMSCCSIET